MQLLLDQARAAAAAGSPVEAIQHARAAAQLADQAKDWAARADAQTLLVQNLFATGRVSEAHELGETTAADWLRLGQPGRAVEVMVLTALGWSEQAQPDRAMSLGHQALDLVEARGLEDCRPRVLTLLGGLHGMLSEWTEGEALLLRALSLARDGHDAAQEVVTLNALLMHLLHACGDYRTRAAHEGAHEAARQASRRLLQHAGRALALADEEPQPFRRAVLRSNAAAALLDGGRTEEAASILEAVVQQADLAGYRLVGLRARIRWAQASCVLGRWDRVQSVLEELNAQLDQQDHPGARQEMQALQQQLAQSRTPGKTETFTPRP